VTTLETDYLVVGAGAMGMAFTDSKSQEVRNKVFGLITAGLRAANDKLDALLSEHLSPLAQAADASR
jgi:hypothetical protein